jgi:hypothetical protein
MIKNRTILLALIIISTTCFGQKQGNNWYFGYGTGLNFSSGIPAIIVGGMTGADVPAGSNQEGTASISDSAGNCLFYTGGRTIWNRLHTPMPNGANIMGGVSSTQSSLIVPLPDNDSILYVFTTDEFQGFNDHPPQKGYRYSVVNMCLDKGNGDVISGQKNILLCDSSTEKLTACQDANGNGYWIIGHKMFSNEFYSWHLTSNGISNAVISSIGSIHGWNKVNSTWTAGSAQGQMKINASGNKLAVAISNFDPAYLELFDFDNLNGVVSNFCHLVIDSSLQMRIFGVEFSPDDSKLYATLSGGSGKHRIYQFNMNANGGNCDSIMTSKFKLAELNNFGTVGIQIAPNDKIYVVESSHQLGCINSPNLSGFSASFDSLAFSCANTGNFMLPNFIAGYEYHNGIPNCLTTNIDEFNYEVKLTITPNPFSEETILKFNKNLSGASLIMYDVFGKQVQSVMNFSGQEITLYRNKLSSGNYFLHLIEDNKLLTSFKIIIVDN